jgi:hypothetical protein
MQKEAELFQPGIRSRSSFVILLVLDVPVYCVFADSAARLVQRHSATPRHVLTHCERCAADGRVCR